MDGTRLRRPGLVLSCGDGSTGGTGGLGGTPGHEKYRPLGG